MSSRIVKQPYERFPLYGSIYKVGETGETVVLATSTVTARDRGNRDVSSSLLVAASKAVVNDPRGGSANALKILITGGTTVGSPYTVTFKMATSLGNLYEVEARVVVEEIDFVVSTTTTTSSTTTTAP